MKYHLYLFLRKLTGIVLVAVMSLVYGTPALAAISGTKAVTVVVGGAALPVADDNDTVTITGNIEGGSIGAVTPVTSLAVTGTTSINTTGGATTNIATGAAATTNIGIAAGTNNIYGATGINVSTNAATNINTGTSTSAVTMGNSANITNLNSATNNIGVNAFATANNIGTGAAASANAIGNTVAATTVTARGGNSTLSVANNDSSLATTNSTMRVTEIGATNSLVNANGKITTGVTTQATAAMTVINASTGQSHGLVVQESKTTISGGTNSTSLTLDDNGAKFANTANGDPVKVTGVADGTADFDAVNWRQLKKAYAGIASVAALAAIPNPANGNKFSIGMGYGNFKGLNAIAVGAKAAITKNISATLGVGYNSSSKETVNAGVGYSW